MATIRDRSIVTLYLDEILDPGPHCAINVIGQVEAGRGFTQ